MHTTTTTTTTTTGGLGARFRALADIVARVREFATWDFLNSVTGGLSKPSKMPCFSWSIPAEKCGIGSRLRALAKNKGIPTVCGSCYALKGRYVFPNVRERLAIRLRAFQRDPAHWAAGMVASLEKLHASTVARVRERARYFRFFDSGDLQSVAMLDCIALIARAVPGTRFWVPTRERAIVREWLAENQKPENLVIRISAPIIGKPASTVADCPTSTVSAGTGFPCPAKNQGNQCADCRACWDPTIANVDYSKH